MKASFLFLEAAAVVATTAKVALHAGRSVEAAIGYSFVTLLAVGAGQALAEMGLMSAGVDEDKLEAGKITTPIAAAVAFGAALGGVTGYATSYELDLHPGVRNALIQAIANSGQHGHRHHSEINMPQGLTIKAPAGFEHVNLG